MPSVVIPKEAMINDYAHKLRCEDGARNGSKFVTGLDGSPLTIADLPAPGTKRWVIRRKAEVVSAVRGGLGLLAGRETQEARARLAAAVNAAKDLRRTKSF
jgi:hypothetical protein